MSNWLSPELQKAVDQLTDAQVVALVLYGEARSEPVQGVIAVGCVIRNRVRADIGHDNKHDWWGEGFKGVCLAPWQFSCLSEKGGAGNFRKVLQFAQKLASKTQITHPQERQCVWIAMGIVGDYVIDPTKASTHYHTRNLLPRPAWTKGEAPVAQIGSHVFYRGIA